MKNRIFVVEDHPSMQEAYALLLNSQADLAVCGTASSGEEALRQIPQVEADLVLVDLSLPGMSGLEFLKVLSTHAPLLRAIIVSGHEREFYMDSKLPNVGAYVMKEEGPETLLETIRRTLAGRRVGDEI
jgi:DNA-binding NarL/FixJ family response regulator